MNDRDSVFELLNKSDLTAKTNPPTPHEREDGAWLTDWGIEMKQPFNAEILYTVSSQAAHGLISINFNPQEDRRIQMTVTRPKEVEYTPAWDASIRALLLLERWIGDIESIEGTARDNWQYHFAAIEHVGALERDKTPLIRAAERGDINELRAVLRSESKSDIEARSLTGGTAIMYAAFGGHIEVVKELLGRGANVILPGREFTLLGAAVTGGREMVRTLIGAGADVNAQNRYGETPLMTATVLGKRDVVEELLKAGAKPTAIDKRGRSALDRLQVRSVAYQEIADLLIQAGASDSSGSK